MNNLISITRKIEFDAAHRVMGHENKCKFLHGHRYSLNVTFSHNHLDNIGRVLDFGIIKDLMSEWINNNWDHNVILSKYDQELGQSIHNITEQKIYYLPFNPTVENLALYLLHEIIPVLFKNFPIKCTKIEIFETPNCSTEINADQVLHNHHYNHNKLLEQAG